MQKSNLVWGYMIKIQDLRALGLNAYLEEMGILMLRYILRLEN